VTKTLLKIGTRRSPLALWQAEHIKARLEARHDGLSVELVGIETKGDKILDVALAKVGGKGLFVKELETALLDGGVDLCVHSTKDMPAEEPAGTTLAAFPTRADPRDCLASPDGKGGTGGVAALPRGARVGTSSLRRQAQLLAQRDDLVIVPVRGNVATRLRKVTELDLTCVVLASAGLDRLENHAVITHRLSPEEMLPAAAQGVLAVQTRAGDERVNGLVSFLDDAAARTTTLCERAFLRGLGGGCQVPIAAHAVLDGDDVVLRGLVARPDGSAIVRVDGRASRANGEKLGAELSARARANGGDAILAALEGAA